MFFYQDTDIARCCTFFDRPGFAGLGSIADAPVCVKHVRMHWGVPGDSGSMPDHACGAPMAPHVARHALHSLESIGHRLEEVYFWMENHDFRKFSEVIGNPWMPDIPSVACFCRLLTIE